MKNSFPKHRKTLYLMMRSEPDNKNATACEAWQTFDAALDACNAAEQRFKDSNLFGFQFYVAACTYYNE
jgi:hypothetical protein